MAELRFKSINAYLTELLKRPRELRRFNVSPGWAVDQLQVSPQRVRAMVSKGIFDSVRTDDGFVLLRGAEVNAYKRLRDRVGLAGMRPAGHEWMERKRERDRKERGCV